jgi:hypothetical protein
MSFVTTPPEMLAFAAGDHCRALALQWSPGIRRGGTPASRRIPGGADPR